MKTIQKKYISTLIWCLSLFSMPLGSCKKFVDVQPPATSISGVNVYNDDQTAIAVLTGIYTSITPVNYLSVKLPIISIYGGLSADELSLWSGITSGTTFAYYTNTLSVTTGGYEFWSFIYPQIYTCNAAIDGLNQSSGLTPAVKKQLLGEAKFMRAFFYFYLVNLYGDVPLVLTSDYKQSAALARTPKAEVYNQIIADLISAQTLLNNSYLDGTLLATTSDKLRPTTWAATALLARTYLYTGDWSNAQKQSSTLISGSPFSLSALTGSTNVFTKNSSEAIWQLQPVNTGWNTEDARLFIIPSSGPSNTNYVYLSPALLNSFEANDARRINWVGSTVAGGKSYYYANKYKSATLNTSVTEYDMVLRLGEQYLIRAEAETYPGVAGGISAAISDLNSIRSRAGLPNYAGATDGASLRAAILHERQIELFSEWGHRWLDLKRTNNVDAVMTAACPAKGTIWNSNQQLYPIPLTDLQTDPNLVQNPGY